MNRHIDPVDSLVAPPDQTDTDARLDTISPAADRPTETTETVTPILDRFAATVTTVAQSQCERATNYAAIETLVCRLPIDRYTFAAHDASAPYSGPSPMALLVRAFIVEKLNGWDDTALHDYLHANPSLRCGLGFETLPAQSTSWRAWNHRFSKELRDAVRECADSIITAARACDVSLPEWVTIGEEDETQSDNRPEH